MSTAESSNCYLSCPCWIVKIKTERHRDEVAMNSTDINNKQQSSAFLNLCCDSCQSQKTVLYAPPICDLILVCLFKSEQKIKLRTRARVINQLNYLTADMLVS